MPGSVAPVLVGDVALANHLPLTLIAGPCMIESRDHCLRMADVVATCAERTGGSGYFQIFL